MSESPLMVKSKTFALEVIRACKALREAKCESALIHQFLRSGTSIGANVAEAQQAQSKPDFISKMNIALKESYETDYWIRLIYATEYVTQNMFESMIEDCRELEKLLIAITKSAKE